MCNFKTDKLVDNRSSVMNKSIIQTDNCSPNLMQMLMKLFCNIWNIFFFIQGFKCQNSSGVAWQAFKGNFSMSAYAYISIISSRVKFLEWMNVNNKSSMIFVNRWFGAKVRHKKWWQHYLNK